jgi:hypothetical protein
MANTNHRTWQKHRIGSVLVSVHLDPIADGHRLQHDAMLPNVTQQLIDFAEAYLLPVTWAVSDPAYSAATPRILRSTIDHEMAILGDENWLGMTAGRTRFARELVRRVSQARAAGIDVKSLVPRVACVDQHIDLVVKQQLTAISGPDEVSNNSRLPGPRAMHYGVWEIPITGRLPLENHRLVPALWTSWTMWRQIRQAAAAAAMYHLVIDAPALAEHGTAATKTIPRLFRRIAELRTRGMVTVETLSVAAKRLSRVPALSPQRSILCRAA